MIIMHYLKSYKR